MSSVKIALYKVGSECAQGTQVFSHVYSDGHQDFRCVELQISRSTYFKRDNVERFFNKELHT